MKKAWLSITLTLACIFFFITFASAEPTKCPQFFLHGNAPEITNQAMKAETRALCYQAFSVIHSGVTKTPLVAASHLTKESLLHAKELSRKTIKEPFHAELSLPARERAELNDYKRSGYDRGHMFPAADSPSLEAMEETFSLANMVPQNPENNRNIWSWIESSVRAYAKRNGDVYVITGPLFLDNTLQKIGRVYVPTHLYKIVYDPKKQKGAAYIVPNTQTTNYSVVSIAELETKAGINFFPSLNSAQKHGKLSLPEPKPHNKSSNKPYLSSLRELFR